MAYTLIATPDPAPSTRVIIRRKSVPPVGIRHLGKRSQRATNLVMPAIIRPT